MNSEKLKPVEQENQELTRGTKTIVVWLTGCTDPDNGQSLYELMTESYDSEDHTANHCENCSDVDCDVWHMRKQIKITYKTEVVE